ncbi:hypothetical protein INR49_014549, partial [Caranx melampygus]
SGVAESGWARLTPGSLRLCTEVAQERKKINKNEDRTCFWRETQGLDTRDGLRNSRSQGLLWQSTVLAELGWAGIPTSPP